MAQIIADTKIAGSFTVGNWRALRADLLDNCTNARAWHKALEVFQKRLNSRFIAPIDRILSAGEYDGEGFAAAALQAILVEFLEAFVQGKVYEPPLRDHELDRLAAQLQLSRQEVERHQQPHAYSSSADLFRSFLTRRQPFNVWFDRSAADTYYRDIRCGLLHEARTKGTTLIRGDDYPDLVRRQKESDALIVNRTAFQGALLSYLAEYALQLKSDSALKTAFIRKMDDLCGIQRVYYFAYGSNMQTAQLASRRVHQHQTMVASLADFRFLYNKRSQDGTSKANVTRVLGQTVWGVCYETDQEDFAKLIGIEKGYNPITVAIRAHEDDFIAAKTFMSDSTCDASPDLSYARILLEGAREHQLPVDYIKTVLTPPTFASYQGAK